MTNEINEIQGLVDNLTTSPHISTGGSEGWSGIFGLGEGLSFIMTFVLFCVIVYIIGVISRYRTSKTWLIPNARYWMNIFRAAGIWLKSLAGVATPKSQVERSDAYYYKPTQDEFDEALLVVHQMMVDGGWTISNYQKRSKDCEDYAMKMSVEIRNYIATTWSEKVGAKGVAVGIVGYVRDVDGAGHVVVVTWIGDDVKYYEPYPGEKYLQEKPMSQDEIDSINMSIM